MFSEDSEYMAVSYDNYRGLSRLRESSGIKSGGNEIATSFVMLFQINQKNVYKKMSKIVLPFGNIKEIGNYPARDECAVTSMEFSDDNHYISMFHQKVKRKDYIPGNE